MGKVPGPKNKQQNRQTDINCFSCRHFYITYDRRFPYGCRAAGFKSRLMPSREMHVHSGMECLLFREKENP
ncbi:MAG TPA: uracil-DNA glycosylase [Deltaproteobacteria bacterium]|nr:uracil-DNA glycosylase [Deltaproteobacteria bacterium]HPR55377.1 uracil-DNA glycosylase [Deltaproteobacteria bacterium]HXK48261.1 uracil-DNA glycosylase [Deltaproteobacteria bacterium]